MRSASPSSRWRITTAETRYRRTRLTTHDAPAATPGEKLSQHFLRQGPLRLVVGLDDVDPGARPDAIGAGVDQRRRLLDRPDAARPLHAHLSPHRRANVLHILNRDPPRPPAGAGLDEVRPHGLGDATDSGLL